MKTCPICKARCFDDMEICYGCMHRFSAESPAREPRVEDMTEMDEMPLRPSAVRGVDNGSNGMSRGMHAAGEAGERRQAVRKDPPRVFGALDDAGDWGDGVCFESEGLAAEERDEPGITVGATSPLLMLTTGPLASAPLGNGYRLVVSVERE